MSRTLRYTLDTLAIGAAILTGISTLATVPLWWW